MTRHEGCARSGLMRGACDQRFRRRARRDSNPYLLIRRSPNPVRGRLAMAVAAGHQTSGRPGTCGAVQLRRYCLAPSLAPTGHAASLKAEGSGRRFHPLPPTPDDACHSTPRPPSCSCRVVGTGARRQGRRRPPRSDASRAGQRPEAPKTPRRRPSSCHTT
jgi:hypothetical protein